MNNFRSIPDDPELPDLLRFQDGSPVESAEDWRRRRSEIAPPILSLEYGGLPPEPDSVTWEGLHTQHLRHTNGVRFISGRIHLLCGKIPFSFLMTLLVPGGEGRFPVVLTGDACWKYATDEVSSEVVRRRYILAQFNRTELAADVPSADRTSGIHRIYPDATFGALAAWAWGFHRCVDVLEKMDFVDSGAIGVLGHSRGGKASLLAGATDERIALTSANNSGCGGAGCLRWCPPGAETIADIVREFPYWFAPGFGAYQGREATLPFDQHFLKAMVAPR